MPSANSEPSGGPSREPELLSLVAAMRRAGIVGPPRAGGFGGTSVDPFTRAILQAERACGAGLSVTEALVDASRDIAADGRAWRLAIAYPVAVCLAAAAGIGWLAAGLAPALEAVLREPGAAAGAWGAGAAGRPATGLLTGVLAGAAAAVVAVAALRAVRRVRGERRGWRVRAATRDVRERLTAAGCQDPARHEILSSVAAAFGERGEPSVAGGPGGLERFPGSGAFRRRLADAGRSRDRRLVPVLGSLAAGVAVLAYGLALVRPVVSMLERVASVPPAAQWRPPR